MRGGIVGINVGANKDTPDRIVDYVRLIELFAPVASYVTINISSPNTPGLRTMQQAAVLDDLLARVVDARERVAQNAGPTPVLLKIAPDLSLSDLDDVVGIARSRRVDGMIVGNTTVGRPPALRDTTKAKEAGGLSGRPLFALANRMLAETYVRVEDVFPLIGAGGIDSGTAALAKIRAGASLIQIYSGLVFRGLGLVAEIKSVAARGARTRPAGQPQGIHRRRCGFGHRRAVAAVTWVAAVLAVLTGDALTIGVRASYKGIPVKMPVLGRDEMIDCYTWTTDNGYKPRMMLEETGLPHKIVPVNLREKAQMSPEFMKISPGHKIPAIVDHDGPGGARVTLCESGAILKYLGGEVRQVLSDRPAARAKVDQWLFYGSATFTTLAQQFGHWTIRSPVKAPTAQEHYDANLRDMLGILDRHLAQNEYFGGAYSIADMTMYSDVHLHGVNDIGLTEYPNVKRWHDAIEARPAVKRAWGPFPA